MAPIQKPPFARDFPKSTELDAIVDAFDRGDYKQVHELGRKLAATTTNQNVKAAAEELMARTKADPLILKLIAMAALLLVFLSAWWVTFAKPPPGAEPKAPATTQP